MADKGNSNKKNLGREYEELVLEIKKELPNIILPSMGMLEELDCIDIDGKDYIIRDTDKEE